MTSLKITESQNGQNPEDTFSHAAAHMYIAAYMHVYLMAYGL